MTTRSTIIQDSALLALVVARGETSLMGPLTLGGRRHDTLRIVRGRLLADGVDVGAIRVRQDRFVISDAAGQEAASLDRWGAGPGAVQLQHPAFPGGRWAERLAADGVSIARPAPTPYAGASQSQPQEQHGAARGRRIAIGLVAAAAVALGLYSLADAPADEPPIRPAVAAASTPEVAPAPQPAPPTPSRAAEPRPPSASESRQNSRRDAKPAAESAPKPTPPVVATAAPTASARTAPTAAAAASTARPTRQTIASPPTNPKPSVAPTRGPVGAVTASRLTGELQVRQGDTLHSLAQRSGARGVRQISAWIETTMRLNGMDAADALVTGQRLRLPDKNAVRWSGDLYSAERYPGPMRPQP